MVPDLDSLVRAGDGAQRAAAAERRVAVEDDVVVAAVVQLVGEVDEVLGAGDDAKAAALAAHRLNRDVSHSRPLQAVRRCRAPATAAPETSETSRSTDEQPGPKTTGDQDRRRSSRISIILGEGLANRLLVVDD